MPRKIYYKVICRRGGRRISAFVGNNGWNKCCLEYPPKERVEAHPLSAGIFVFDSREAAVDFTLNFITDLSVLRCHGHGRPRRLKALPTSKRDEIDNFFYKKSWPSAKKCDHQPPEGTVLFKAITCIE